MVWMILFFITLALLIILVIFGIVQLQARIKNQDMVFKVFQKMNKALNIMREIDRTGAFQAHDQVGETFMLLTGTLEQLRNYILEQLKYGQKERKQ